MENWNCKEFDSADNFPLLDSSGRAEGEKTSKKRKKKIVDGWNERREKAGKEGGKVCCVYALRIDRLAFESSFFLFSF